MLIDFNRAGTHTFQTDAPLNCTLKPGINMIPNKVWKNVLSKERNVRFIDSRPQEFIIVSDGEDTKEATCIQQIESEQTIEQLMTRCHNEILIQSWLDVEQRPVVANILRKRLKYIDEQTNPKKEKVG